MKKSLRRILEFTMDEVVSNPPKKWPPKQTGEFLAQVLMAMEDESRELPADAFMILRNHFPAVAKKYRVLKNKIKRKPCIG